MIIIQNENSKKVTKILPSLFIFKVFLQFQANYSDPTKLLLMACCFKNKIGRRNEEL